MDLKSEEVLARIEEETKYRFMPIVGRKKGKLLEELVKRRKPKAILEIGTLVGYSAILMARNMKAGRIITIERSIRNAKQAEKNIKDAGFGNKVQVLAGDALKAIKRLKEKFDMVFIDAAKEEYVDYLKLLEKQKLIRKGTIIVADNAKIFADAMKEYLDFIRKSGLYRSSFHDFGFDGMEVSVKI
ncbi:O-methyltransferase [Candidatus Woesearchaeota archaeon]|nr:O-methyltransferase [Candidatus Woesearchaeota archaeon]